MARAKTEGNDPPWWRLLVTPTVVVATAGVTISVFSCQLNNIEGRLTNLDTKIDRRAEAIEGRLTTTNDRLDSGLEGQTTLQIKLNKVETDVQFVRQQFNALERRIPRESPPGRIQEPLLEEDETPGIIR